MQLGLGRPFNFDASAVRRTVESHITTLLAGLVLSEFAGPGFSLNGDIMSEDGSIAVIASPILSFFLIFIRRVQAKLTLPHLSDNFEPHLIEGASHGHQKCPRVILRIPRPNSPVEIEAPCVLSLFLAGQSRVGAERNSPRKPKEYPQLKYSRCLNALLLSSVFIRDSLQVESQMRNLKEFINRKTPLFIFRP